MGSLNPENNSKEDLDDSGCVEDASTSDTYKGRADLLDLSDDVLLYILRLCTPRDLKALGHTCPRLGALICDHTLWQRVDARGQPIGQERLRWYLDNCLSSTTQELKLTGYVNKDVKCLGIRDLTWPEEQGVPGVDGNSMEQLLLRMWIPNLPRYAVSPRWPDKKEAEARAANMAGDLIVEPLSPISQLATDLVAEACGSGTDTAPSTSNSSHDASHSNNDASISSNDASKSTNDASKSTNDASTSSNDASNSSNDATKSSNDALKSINDERRAKILKAMDDEIVDMVYKCKGPQFTLNPILLKVLRTTCTNLTTLVLEYCNLDYKYTNLRFFPPKLKMLSLKGTRCYNLPMDTSYLGKIQDRLPELEHLDISECEWFEPASLMPLSKVPRLHSLYMKHCRRLSECVAYASLATRYGFQQLKVLDIRGCPVADTEVSAFGWLPLLEELYVSSPSDLNTITEHSHTWDDLLLPTISELEPWERDVPEYFRPKSPIAMMEEDEPKDEDTERPVLYGYNRAAYERRVIVIHPNRIIENQNQAQAQPRILAIGQQNVPPQGAVPRPPLAWNPQNMNAVQMIGFISRNNRRPVQGNAERADAAQPQDLRPNLRLPRPFPGPQAPRRNFSSKKNLRLHRGPKRCGGKVPKHLRGKKITSRRPRPSVIAPQNLGPILNFPEIRVTPAPAENSEQVPEVPQDLRAVPSSPERRAVLLPSNDRRTVLITHDPNRTPSPQIQSRNPTPGVFQAPRPVSNQRSRVPQPGSSKRRHPENGLDLVKRPRLNRQCNSGEQRPSTSKSSSDINEIEKSQDDMNPLLKKIAQNPTPPPPPPPPRPPPTFAQTLTERVRAFFHMYRDRQQPEPGEEPHQLDEYLVEQRPQPAQPNQGPHLQPNQGPHLQPNRIRRPAYRLINNQPVTEPPRLLQNRHQLNAMALEIHNKYVQEELANLTPERPMASVSVNIRPVRQQPARQEARQAPPPEAGLPQPNEEPPVAVDAGPIPERQNPEPNPQPNAAPNPQPNAANNNAQNAEANPAPGLIEARVYPAVIRGGNQNRHVQVDIDIQRQNFPMRGANLVSDSAVLRFGRADNDNIIHIGENLQPNEPGFRPDRSNLRVLSMTGYNHITDRSLEHLATAAPYIRFIDFSQTRVTARGVEFFKAIRPDCEVVYTENAERI